jgi:DNA repair photolyase
VELAVDMVAVPWKDLSTVVQKLRKATVRFVMTVCLTITASVWPFVRSNGKTLLPLDKFQLIFYLNIFKN